MNLEDLVRTTSLACATLLAGAIWGGAQTFQQQSGKPKAPVVLVVGCAKPSAQPHIWILSHASVRLESLRAAITTDEKKELAKQPLGQDMYQLIGVADFVDRETSRTIGVRGEILAPSRVNSSGVLAHGRKVAVKGLYIEAKPPRINLLSVVELGQSCP